MDGDEFVRERLRAFLAEDIGNGDLTTTGLPRLAHTAVRAQLRAREPGVLAGLEFALDIFRLLDPGIQAFPPRMEDGQAMEKGSVLAVLAGNATGLLQGERTALNLLQRLSGIATATRSFVRALQGSATLLLDTRKTTPGFRYFEKYAVRVGGGHNHRLGLYDGVMLKDNHLAAAGDIGVAVSLVRERAPVTVRVEVEVETLAQVRQAVQAGADIIMLDNMAPEQMREAITLIGGRAKVEASGRIRLEDLPALAKLGLDYISTSAMVTRSRWLDIGLDFID
jgi:nicotinate-nucleotide pyrophosphorylase (carboxylating)